MMPAGNLVDRLAGHRTIGAAPREELSWLACHGTLRQMQAGEVLTAKGTRPAGLFVVLSGSFTMSVDRGAGPRKIMEWREGDVMGLLPYSRVAGPPGDSVAQEFSEILAVDGGQIREMTDECHEITAILVHAMIDRARAFTSSDLHDEKMVSLGKLSAGLAHELNNPASAIERSAALLDDRLEDAERATARARRVPADAMRNWRPSMPFASPAWPHRSPACGRPSSRPNARRPWPTGSPSTASTSVCAEALADTAVTFEALDLLAGAVDGPALNAVLRWGAAGCSVRSLASEIQDAAMRISGLVAAIKGFTHMDQAAVAEPVDLVQGLSNTVAVLRSKARAKSAAVVVEVEPGLPRVRGFAGELNQIWANLIDNALDAVPDSGRVEVLANREDRRWWCAIMDNGAGIPAQIRERIFDPFFTTKPMGQGTGLGLDIVRRLVRHNDGEIAVESQPGRTEFRVVLPLAEIDGAGGTR